MKTQNSDRKTFTVKESYRNLAFVAVFKKDQLAKSWQWKGSIDFDSGKILFTGRGAFESEQQAKITCFNSLMDALTIASVQHSQGYLYAHHLI
jgi:hypothetical protein